MTSPIVTESQNIPEDPFAADVNFTMERCQTGAYTAKHWKNTKKTKFNFSFFFSRNWNYLLYEYYLMVRVLLLLLLCSLDTAKKTKKNGNICLQTMTSFLSPNIIFVPKKALNGNKNNKNRKLLVFRGIKNIKTENTRQKTEKKHRKKIDYKR